MLNVSRIKGSQHFGGRVYGLANLLLVVNGGDEKAEPGTLFFDGGMQNRQDIDAALKELAGGDQRMGRIAQDHGHDRSAIAIARIQAGGTGQFKEERRVGSQLGN